MGVLLEIREGPFAGKKVAVAGGQSVTFGRAVGRAEFALPHDTFMSGVHFAVECGSTGCRVQDRKSSNGTFLNGARVQDAMLANGDEIKGGQTIFTVRVVPDAQLAAMAPSLQEAAPPAAQELSSPPEPALPFGRPPASEQPPRSAEPTPRSIEPSQPVAAREPEPPAAAEQPRPRASEPAPPVVASPPPSTDAPARVVPPPPERPRFRAIPTPPVGEPKSPRVSDSAAPSDAALRAARKPVAEANAQRPSSLEAGGSRGFAFSVMGWSFPAAPAEWQVQEGFGLQQSGHEEFPSSVAATEELLGGITLQQFVESQISMLRGYLREPKIEPTMPPRVGGADESMAMDVRHSTKDGRELVYRRIYARSGPSVGVLTVTTLAAELPQVLQSLQALLDGAAFRSTVSH